MSGLFFFEHIVEAVLNLEEQSKNAESKSSKPESVKKPKKK